MGTGMSAGVGTRVNSRVGASLSGGRRFNDLFHFFEELKADRLGTGKYRKDRVITSIMIAKGTQQATAQETPTKLTMMMAYLELSASFED